MQYEDLGQGITCIDAEYVRPGLACFYLLQQGDECAVIETGTVHSVPGLETLLAQRNIAPEQVRYVIPTHVHLDHAGGAGLMMARFPEAQLLVHPRGARHLIDPAKLVAGSRAVYGDTLYQQLYGEILPVPAARVVEIADGDEISLAGRSLLFRHTPGHADHHFCVWDALSRGWFSGDVFGLSYPQFRLAGGDYAMLSTTPTQFRPAALAESLELLAAASPRWLYLTHFGRLAYSPALLALLQGQLQAYQRLAEELGGEPDAMAERIAEHALAGLQKLEPELDPVAMRTVIAQDARLNAQGLAVWRERQS